MTLLTVLNQSPRLRRGAIVGACTLTAALGYSIRSAADIPSSPDALVYSGTLTDGAGAPESGDKEVTLKLYDAATNGTTLCAVTKTVPLDASGHFQIAMDEDPTCLPAIESHQNVYVEVTVDSTLVGRSKVGAVPYAVEAKHAVEADHAGDADHAVEANHAGDADTADNATQLGGYDPSTYTYAAGSGLSLSGNTFSADTSILEPRLPPKTVVNAYLTAPDIAAGFSGTGLGNVSSAYNGWAICNGQNGTPNLSNRFVRINVAGAGATGGSDTSAHTHAIDHNHGSFTSGAGSAHHHSTPDHQHGLPIGFDSASVYYWGEDGGSYPYYGSNVFTVTRGYNTISGSFSTGAGRFGLTQSAGASTTGDESAHTHPVDPPAFTGTSGASSNTENRPAYYELVALMRL